MVVFVVKSGIWSCTCKKSGDVFDAVGALFKGKEPQIAIDVSSWCEIATIGEVYEHDKFTVEVVET